MKLMQELPSRNRVWLNNLGLADIDPAIHVHDIAYSSPGITTSTVEHARYHGARVSRQRMGSSGVTVQFDVREYDIAARQQIINRIAAWAMKGGILTTDDRPGQRLHVVCTTPPTISSSLRWTARLTLEFTAFDNPCWEDVTPKALTLTGTDESGNLYGAGTAADPYVTATVEAGADITQITLNAGDTTFELTGISVQAGETLEIGYDGTNTLYIRNTDTGVSYLEKRSASSHDDLMIPVGRFSEVGFSSDGMASVTYRVRGLYL